MIFIALFYVLFSYEWNKNTPLLELIRRFCVEKGVGMSDYRFLFEKSAFAYDATPAQLGMQIGDKIGVELDETTTEFDSEPDESDSELDSDHVGMKTYQIFCSSVKLLFSRVGRHFVGEQHFKDAVRN